MNNFQDLIKKVSEITESGLPFMEGKTNLEVGGSLLDTTITVTDYGYLNGENGEYVVLALKEYPNNFIYGSSVVTQSFKKLDEKLNGEEIETLLNEGLPIRLSKLVSANKRKYTKVVFFPNN